MPMDAGDELEGVVQALAASAVADEEDAKWLAAAVTLKAARTQGQGKELRNMCTMWKVNRYRHNQKLRAVGELRMEL
ncbi:hypothetical protein N9L19_00860 [bacterium]|nr:hypothetical protein [bacterium]